MTRSTTLFTKRPQAGIAKTRLSPPLTPKDAARLAQAMLLDSAECLGAAPDLGPGLAIATAKNLAWFETHVPWLPRPESQVGQGLGQRLAHHFSTRDSKGTAVVIGSDQPLVSLERMRQAHELLEQGSDLVLGPDQGGGYYLIGLRASHPELFLEIGMSTEGMCRATSQLAEAHGLRVKFLEAELDVDTGSDLKRLRDRIEQDSDSARKRAPRTCLVMQDFASILKGLEGNTSPSQLEPQ